MGSPGVGLLAAIIQVSDKKVLDRQTSTSQSTISNPIQTLIVFVTLTAKTLTTFLTEKLSDAASLIPCVAGLTGLTESSSFGVGEGMEVVRG